MWRWRTLYISTFTLLSRPSREYCKKEKLIRGKGVHCGINNAFTHAVQFLPGLIARCKQGEGAFAFDLLSDPRPVGVFLGRQSPHEVQSTVHMVNGSHYGEHSGTENVCVHWQGNWAVLIMPINKWHILWENIYLQDILSCLLASCTQDSTHKGLHCAPPNKKEKKTHC